MPLIDHRDWDDKKRKPRIHRLHTRCDYNDQDKNSFSVSISDIAEARVIWGDCCRSPLLQDAGRMISRLIAIAEQLADQRCAREREDEDELR